MVYVEWKYFDAVTKGKVVADRKVLWWGARHDSLMVANLVIGVLSACFSYTTKQCSSESCSSSPGLILNKESLLLTPPTLAFSALFMLLPFLSTTSLGALPFYS